jgi:hypothetical protein
MGLGIKSRVKYFIEEMAGKHQRFGPGYYLWQSRRIRAMLDHYGHEFFANKSVTELGAGFGDIGGFFSMLGFRVICLEGRVSNTAEIRKRYPAVMALQHDCNNPLPLECRKVDFVIHFGVLYHLRDPAASLRDACGTTNEMVLETECVDSSDPHFFRQTQEHTYVKGHALDGIGCSPSPAFIERILTEQGMSFIRVDDKRCNADDHFYDWPIKNNGVTKKGQRKFWFVKRR